MAKSELRVVESDGAAEDTFDLEAFMKTDFSTLPPEQVLSGAWVVKWISSFIAHGTNERGPWVAVDINFDPQEPVGDDAETVMSELNMHDLPRIKPRIFISSLAA